MDYKEAETSEKKKRTESKENREDRDFQIVERITAPEFETSVLSKKCQGKRRNCEASSCQKRKSGEKKERR